MNIKTSLLTILIFLNSMLIAQTNNPPRISSDFPDTVITKQGVSHKDSIFALPLADFDYDSDGDSLNWSTATEDSVVAFFSAHQDTLYVHSQNNWYGRGKFTIKLADAFGGYDEKEVSVIAFKRDGTLLSKDGSKTEYYIPWHPQLDFNRINFVEGFLMEEGYKEEDLCRDINYNKYQLREYMKDVNFLRCWCNEQIEDGYSWKAQKMVVDYTLDELKYDNVEWIRIRLSYFMDTPNSNQITQRFEYFYGAGWLGLSMRDFELKYVINQAHNKDFKVTIAPFISDIGFARGDINPPSWDIWFENYANIVYHLAEIAQETGVDIFIIGESLVNTTGTISDEDWGNEIKQIIYNVRKIYSGPITYLDGLLARVDEQYYPEDWQKRYTFLDDLDIVSSGSYFIGLIEKEEPTVTDIVNKYPYFIDRVIKPLHDLTKKPVIFYENGVPSRNGVLYNFIEFVAGNYRVDEVDLEEQAIWYEALFKIFQDIDWFFGLGWYGNSWLPLSFGWHGVKDNNLSFRLKPAEDIVRYYYGNGDTKKRLINIDSKFDDWKDTFLLTADPIGDSKNNYTDLIGFYGLRDDMYIYLRVELNSGLRETDIITILIDTNADNEPEHPCGVFYGTYGKGKWMAKISTDMTFSNTLGSIDVIEDSSNSNFEFRIPLRFFNYIEDIRFKVWTESQVDSGIHDEIDGFHQIPFINPTAVNRNIANSSFPKHFSLSQNYPNPFNPSTTINFSIPKSSGVKITIII